MSAPYPAMPKPSPIKPPSPPASSMSLLPKADDSENRAAAVGFGDRIDARIEPRADERLHAGQGELLKLRIGQINDLRHEVAGQHLIEIFFGELDRNRVVARKASVRGVVGPISTVG